MRWRCCKTSATATRRRSMGTSLYEGEGQMPSFSFDEGSIPTREELKRLLEEIRQQSNPVEDLIDLNRTLARLEEKYGMTSAEFFEKFSRGEMGDNVEIV